jgi:hypothetical protein
MKRREFITLLGCAVAWPLAARAQQAGKVHRIGFLGSATAPGSAKAVESLRTGLREFGYVEGTNIGFEFRWAEGNYNRLPHLVAELLATNVDVLITHGNRGVPAFSLSPGRRRRSRCGRQRGSFTRVGRVRLTMKRSEPSASVPSASYRSFDALPRLPLLWFP